MLAAGYTKPCLLFALIAAIAGPAVVAQFDPPIPCQEFRDCTAFASNAASCTNGFCACESGTRVRNCSSADIVRHNRRGAIVSRGCRVNQDCQYPENSFCNTTISQCECHKDYVLSATRKACLKKAEALDLPCVELRQCRALLANTTCEKGQCRCISGYHPVRNVCYETIGIGESCTRSEECEHVSGAVCTDGGRCDCAAETVIDAEGKRCLPVSREILDSCTEDAQCAATFPDALCVDQACRCRDRYHFEPEMGRCFVDKGFGENCGNTYECREPGDEAATERSLTCTENICVCADDHWRSDDRCVSAGTRILPSLMAALAGVVAQFALLGRF